MITNVASTFAFVALFRGAVFARHNWMDSLARGAYVMYLVQYVFATFVTALSLMTAQVALRIPGVRSAL